MHSTVMLNYDAATRTLYLTHPTPVVLQTADDVLQHYRQIQTFWRQQCGGQKVYFIAEFRGLSFDASVAEAYRASAAALLKECAITMVRYGGNVAQRSASRMISVKLHTPSHIYESREEAVDVVRRLREGSITIAA